MRLMEGEEIIALLVEPAAEKCNISLVFCFQEAEKILQESVELTRTRTQIPNFDPQIRKLLRDQEAERQPTMYMHDTGDAYSI